MAANAHATTQKVKDYTNVQLDDQMAEEKFKTFMTDANEWFERFVGKIGIPTPVTITDDTTAVSSMNASGRFLLANADNNPDALAKGQFYMKQSEKDANDWAINQDVGGTKILSVSKAYRSSPLADE